MFQLPNDPYKLALQYVQYTNRCLFLTGKAGTGKTTFLRNLHMTCHKQMAIVAPTGVAAMNAGGVTIHSLFQLPPEVFLPTPEARRRLFGEMQMRDAKRRVLRNLELLVIDEISMVRADLLDTIDAVLRHFKYRDIPFGGVQVLMIGDLYQLPPVATREVWDLLRDWYSGPYFFQANVLQQIQPVYIELNHVYRQDDQTFIDILNEVRICRLSPANLERLNSRYNPELTLNDTNKTIDFKRLGVLLSTHNRTVDRINERELQHLSGKEFAYQAEVKDIFPDSMFPMEQTLRLKQGARVMFVRNDSGPNKAYYNGKLGEVSALDAGSIMVHCDDGTDVEVSPETWENTRYNSKPGSEDIVSEVIGTFTQYPLRLAWAVTIHKAQGLTFDHVIIDAKQAFASGQVYVALSRCRSLEGITLTDPIAPNTVTNAYQVVDFTSRQKPLELTSAELQHDQISYWVKLLCGVFDFRELIATFSYLQHQCSQITSLQSDESEWLKDKCRLLEDQQHYCESFHAQIQRILLVSDGAPKVDYLQERVQHAADYFMPVLKEVAEAIDNIPLRSNDKADAKLLQNIVQDFYADVCRKMFVMSHIAKDVRLSSLLNVQSAFRASSPEAVIYTLAKKKRAKKTTAKTATKTTAKTTKRTTNPIQRISGFALRVYAAHLRGNSIEQIARDHHVSEAEVAEQLRLVSSLGLHR